MKGIIFTSESVKGIIEGRKTQTRRMVTPQPLEESRWMGWLLDSTGKEDSNRIGHACWRCDSIGRYIYAKPRYEVGDVVYVKETFANIMGGPPFGFTVYRADRETLTVETQDGIAEETPNWKSPLFMKESASRIHIEITGVKAQLVQDITKEEAIAEGIKVLPLQDESDPSAWYQSAPGVYQARSAVVSYALLWDSINGKKHPWKSNPWVFAYTFKKVEEK